MFSEYLKRKIKEPKRQQMRKALCNLTKHRNKDLDFQKFSFNRSVILRFYDTEMVNGKIN